MFSIGEFSKVTGLSVKTYVKEKGYRVALPTREVYLKGPGMILKGNPKKYLTEIQMLLEA